MKKKEKKPLKKAVKPKNKKTLKPKAKKRTVGGKVPKGRTLTTRDKYLDKKAKEPEKERPVVVIDVNANNELAVVQLSTQKGKNRTRLKKYQQGQSLYKHYVEVEDSDGEPIKINVKFKENHPNMDVSIQEVDEITDTVLNHSKPMQENRKRINKFRNKKK